ncbi:ABC transporter permease [Lentzea jiangxiensis]|uniref:Transport permease protein n=1 Tax=Lentzea jiangxiensis TaxID=641025 RepID=A0A1H0WVJ7_9PSEU|nr:ABC transporter permease [Lentzea jiangxiensis]SDP94733.1 ABC-type multidrug transport system, permease component [Lentzea jiangxiensis]
MNAVKFAAVDSWVVAKRDLIHWVREPVRVFANLAYPVISVLIFGLVFGSAMNVFGGGDYIEFLLPGMFGQTIAFGVGTTLMMVSMDADRGVTDRFRASSMSQTGVVAGRSIADLVNSSLELLVLALCGLVIGWSFHDGLLNALLAFALLLWLRFALVWIGIYLGLLVKPEAAQASWMFLFPLTMFANTFVSPELMPGWLRVVAEWNPLSSTVAAARELFGNPGVGGDSWAAQHSLLLAVLWPAVFVAIFWPLSVLKYRNLSR